MSIERTQKNHGEKQKISHRIMKLGNDRGYRLICLRKDGRKYTRRVSRVVALAFIPKVKGKPWVNHIDSNRANNRVSNLEWCTPSENVIHAHKYGNASQVGSRNPGAKVTESDVLAIRRQAAEGVPHKKIAKQFGIGYRSISRITTRRGWTHI